MGDKTYVPIIIVEVVIFILFCVFGTYKEGSNLEKYPMFQDIHVMIFIGFGFLMIFLKRYGYSSVGFTLLLGAFIIQWGLICQGLYDLSDDYKIELGLESLYGAEIAAASVLISVGVVLGKTSVTQLFIMGAIEMVVYTGNLFLGMRILKVSDAGASIFVHTFGAYFGLAVSFVLNRSKDGKPEAEQAVASLQESNYTSDLLAMIGTVFLWIYWPSFNAIDVQGDQQLRAIVNTYLSLASCILISFAISQLLSEDSKFDMVHVQNSTLAGGVAVGATCNLMLHPWGAVLIGAVAGVISVVGYSKVTPALEKYLKIPDTCGVHNLHGMPGILGAIASAVMAGIATEEMYHDDLYKIYPAMIHGNLTHIDTNYTGPKNGRHAAAQAWYQIIALTITIGLAVISGLITGFILRHQSPIAASNHYDDATYWTLPEEPVPQMIFEKGVSFSNAGNLTPSRSLPLFQIGEVAGDEEARHAEDR